MTYTVGLVFVLLVKVKNSDRLRRQPIFVDGIRKVYIQDVKLLRSKKIKIKSDESMIIMMLLFDFNCQH